MVHGERLAPHRVDHQILGSGMCTRTPIHYVLMMGRHSTLGHFIAYFTSAEGMSQSSS